MDFNYTNYFLDYIIVLLGKKNMSLNNVLPFWVVEVALAREEAMSLCGFKEEWFSGTPQCMPEHVIRISKSTFSTWNYGGWNYRYSQEEIDELKKKAA